MTTKLAIALAIGLVLGAAAPGMTAGKGASKKGGKAGINIEGHVQSTDKKKNLVTIKTDSGAVILKIERQTKIIRGSKEDLEPR